MNRITELRKKAGMTQNELGETLGVSQQTISKYESADINVPGDMLSKMGKLFKVTIEHILSEEDCEEHQKSDLRFELMELYRNLDQYNRDTWIILGKRLLGGQIEDYENLLIEKR